MRTQTLLRSFTQLAGGFTYVPHSPSMFNHIHSIFVIWSPKKDYEHMVIWALTVHHRAAPGYCRCRLKRPEEWSVHPRRWWRSSKRRFARRLDDQNGHLNGDQNAGEWTFIEARRFQYSQVWLLKQQFHLDYMSGNSQEKKQRISQADYVGARTNLTPVWCSNPNRRWTRTWKTGSLRSSIRSLVVTWDRSVSPQALETFDLRNRDDPSDPSKN